MSALEKLEQALLYMKEAERLVGEAAKDNDSLKRYCGYSLEILCQQLRTFSDNPQGYYMSPTTPLATIIAAEGERWQQEPGSPGLAHPVASPRQDAYFPGWLRSWIRDTLATDLVSTHSELEDAFVEKGIDRNIASQLIAAEREPSQRAGGSHTIDFSQYEPVDDRIFSAADMHDFARQISREAMGAAFSDRTSIQGMSLHDYIENELDQRGGDEGYETWIPRKRWPKAEAPTVSGEAQAKKVSPKLSRNGPKKRRH